MSYSSPPPLVSVIIPVRNESAFVADLVRAVLAQDYPRDRVEVVVVDGMSDDGTREILDRLRAENPRLVVVDNPARIVPAGLNLGIACCRGEVIVRIDGHALIASDFIRQNVALLNEHQEAWSVGGPMRHAAVTPFGRAVAIAMSHPAGVGSAPHRYAGYEGYADSVQFPAFRRWVFDRIGTFDERLVRNQDDEFNFRVTSAGGRIYVSPRVRYSYFVRERIGQLFTQYFQYGFWRVPVMEKHGRPTSWRYLAPLGFYSMCGALLAAGVWLASPVVALGAPALYALALGATGATSVRRHGLRVASRVPVAIATMHAAYAAGLAYGLWARFFHPAAWDAQGTMSTVSR